MLSFFCGFSLFSYVTLYVHWTVYYIILLTVYSVVQCCTTVYNVVQCTMLYSAQCCTVYSVQCCTVYSVQCWTSVHCCTVYSVQCCTVYNDEQCTVYNIVQCTTRTYMWGHTWLDTSCIVFHSFYTCFSVHYCYRS